MKKIYGINGFRALPETPSLNFRKGRITVGPETPPEYLDPGEWYGAFDASLVSTHIYTNNGYVFAGLFNRFTEAPSFGPSYLPEGGFGFPGTNGLGTPWTPQGSYVTTSEETVITHSPGSAQRFKSVSGQRYIRVTLSTASKGLFRVRFWYYIVSNGTGFCIDRQATHFFINNPPIGQWNYVDLLIPGTGVQLRFDFKSLDMTDIIIDDLTWEKCYDCTLTDDSNSWRVVDGAARLDSIFGLITPHTYGKVDPPLQSYIVAKVPGETNFSVLTNLNNIVLYDTTNRSYKLGFTNAGVPITGFQFKEILFANRNHDESTINRIVAFLKNKHQIS